MQTLYTTLVGFLLGIVAGTALGVLVGSSRLAYDVAHPLLIGFASIRRWRWCRSWCCGSALGVALYAIFSIIEGRVTGWAMRRDDFASSTT